MTLSEKTLVPISLVIILVGVAAWAANVAAQVSSLQTRMDALESIDKRLSRIEGKLGISE